MRFPLRFLPSLALILLLTGCQAETEPQKLNYGMGERVPNGPLTYLVIESTWASQLGEVFQARVPKQRFLMLSISVTNGGGGPINLPLLTLEDASGNQYQELSDGTGVSNWLGILRTIDPGQTVQGRLLFDVPLAAFKLRLPNDGEPGYEKFAMVDIPLRIDSDQVLAPLPGPVLK
jgi:hypothetical protein